MAHDIQCTYFSNLILTWLQGALQNITYVGSQTMADVPVQNLRNKTGSDTLAYKAPHMIYMLI